MANEKRLIFVDAVLTGIATFKECYEGAGLKPWILEQIHTALQMVERFVKEYPTVDAVEVEKYEALVEMYHELRENFIDYVCSGVPNVAPYCLNRCEECVTPHGWCKALSDKCQGFNPAEVILDEERKARNEARKAPIPAAEIDFDYEAED